MQTLGELRIYVSRRQLAHARIYIPRHTHLFDGCGGESITSYDALRKKMADLGKDQQAEPSEVVPKEKYDRLLKLLLVGDSGVGKSSVIRRYSNDFRSSVGKRGHVFNLTFLSSPPSLCVV